MDGNASGEDYENIDWDTDDELEIQNIAPSSCPSLVTRNAEVIVGNGEASSSAGPSNSNLLQHFLGMGFSEGLIVKAIKENGETNTESILESLLTYAALEGSPDEVNPCHLNSPPQQQQCLDNGQLSSDYDESILDDLSESDSWSGSEVAEIPCSLPEHEKTILSLANMGYSVEEASAAVDRCGPQASIAELTDFIGAAQMAKSEDVFFEEEKPKFLLNANGGLKKRKLYELELLKRKKRKGLLNEEDDVLRLPNPMIGFGVPSEPAMMITHRTLPEAAIAPPYFYYENVALAPKGVWDTISRFLYDVQPEFVDSKYFCAAARKRGYVHNLPIDNRYPLLPLPPRTS